MKIFKKLLVALSVFFVLSFSILVAAHIYTKEKTVDFADKLARSKSYQMGTYYGKVKPISVISLGDALYKNVHVNGSSAGDYTTEEYKTGFRAVLANNPSLAYKAWDLYKLDFITSFEESMKAIVEEKLKKLEDFDFRTDTTSRMRGYVYMPNKKTGKSEKITLKEKQRIFTYKHYAEKGDYKVKYDGYHKHIYYPVGAKMEQLKKFSMDSFWEKQKNAIKHYQELMDALLELPDDELNSYMNEIKEKFTGYNWDYKKRTFQDWLISKKLLAKLPKGGKYSWGGDMFKDGAWDIFSYPVDFLFLAVRVQRDFPEQWPYKKFITEARKFSDYVLKDLPD